MTTGFQFPLDEKRGSRQQERDFPILYEAAEKFLGQFGVERAASDGDFWVVDDNYGPKQHKIYFNNLKMLAPPIVYGLQQLLNDFPDWDWVVAISIDGHLPPVWPEMGLIIRNDEIIDGLQRQYFPPEYRDWKYEGARVGTDRD
jgi:hypothetical protein